MIEKIVNAALTNKDYDGEFVVDDTTFVIDPDNNRIGVGTASPSTQLHIYDATASANPLVTLEANPTTNRGHIVLSTTTAGVSGIEVDGDENNGTAAFETAFLYREATNRWGFEDKDGNIMVVIENVTGRVGIGTAAPAAALDVTGNIVVSGTVDGRDVATDGAKLDGIESNATADQTAADIRGLGFFDTTNDGTGSGLDADLLDGNEATAFATSAQGSLADSALQDLIDDASPQLGGILDVNGYEIIGSTIDLHSAGDVIAELGDAAGVNKISIRDSGGVEVASVNSDGDTSVQDLTVAGDLTVNGTTTTVNSTVVTIDDPLFTLGGDTAPVADDNKDRGIEFRWHNGTSDKTGFFGFDDSTGKFTFIPDGTNTSEVYSGTKGDLDIGALDVTGNIVVSGTVDGRDVAADGSKLDGIESGATADQTAADIRALGFFDITNDGTGSGLDADLLDGNEATAFATAAQGATADSALQNVVEDTTPQLGGMLDVNTFAIGDGTRELITFTEDASAVNHINVENEATGSGPILSSAGDDVNVDLNISTKGSGAINLNAATSVTGNITVTGTVDGRDVAADGTKLDGIEASADVTDAANVETSIEAITLSNVSGATGDEVLIIDATDGGLKAVLWENLPGAGGGGINNLIEDTTPQLGGMLDVNAFAIGDGTRELISFTEDASAVNHINIENEATGSGPIISSTGDDLNVDLDISTKGTGTINLNAATSVTGNITVTGTVDGRDVAADGTKLDGIESGATADQTAADIRALGFFDTSNDGTGSLLDADLLDGNEATAFATAAQGATADSALQNLIEDTTPQLGGHLDINGQALGDGTRELLTFVEDALAVNHVSIENQATGSGPIISSTGDDVNVDLVLATKGTGVINLNAASQLGGQLDVNGFEIVGTLVDIHSATDVYVELGDAAGAYDFKVKDSSGTTRLNINSDGEIEGGWGTASKVGIGFLTDTDTGMYRIAADDIGLSTGGTLRWGVNGSRVQQTVPLELPDGSTTTPALSFSSDNNTGITWYANGEFSIVSNSREEARIVNGDIRGAQGTGAWLLKTGTTVGSQATPGYAFVGDLDTGLYRIGADDFAAGAGNSECMSWTSGSSVFVTSGLTTTTGENTLRWNATTYEVLRFTSLAAHKTDVLNIAELQEAVGERSLLYDLRPVLFHEKDQIKMVPDPDWEHPLDEAGFPIPDVVAPMVPKSHNTSRGQYIAGFIAEEVHDVAPELTSFDENGDLSTLSVETLIPHLVAEVQRLGEMVETLQEAADPTYQRPAPRSAGSSAAEKAIFDTKAAETAVTPNEDLKKPRGLGI